MKKCILFSLLVMTSFTARAMEQTVTLNVPTMNCATCPITVKKALQNVEGVIDAEVSYKPKQAIVKFDDKKATVEQLINATTNAGYPSTVKQ